MSIGQSCTFAHDGGTDAPFVGTAFGGARCAGGLLAGQPIYAGMDITHYQSEVRAWGITQSILKAGNFTQPFNCGAANCKLGANVAIGNDKKLPAQLGGVIDTILANQPIYNQGGSPMGPNNQGGNIVNGITLRPKTSVPH